MTQAGNTGSLDQILRMMAGIAESAAFTTEVNALTAELGTPWTSTLQDANGANFTVSLAESAAMSNYAWVHTSFSKVVAAENLRLSGSFPRLVLLGQRGTVASVGDQRDWRILRYVVDAVVMTERDNAVNAEREALLMATAYAQLIDRNSTLGGLVYLVEIDGPPAPASTGSTAEHGVVGGALTRYIVESRFEP